MPMVDFLKSHSFVTFQNSLLHSILTNATFPKPKTISFTTYKEQSASILIMTFILVFPQAQESRILLFKARLLPFWYKGIQAQGCILRGFWSDKFFFFNLFFYFWLHWVFVAARRLPLVVASGGYSLLQCAGFSLWWLLLLQSTGSRSAGFSSCGTHAQQLWRSLQSSVVVAHGLSCSVACGIFPDQGSKLCPLHWQADT